MDMRQAVAGLLGPDWTGTALHLESDEPAGTGGLRSLWFRRDDGAKFRALYLPSRTGAVVLYCHAHGNRYDIGADELPKGRPALGAPWLPVFVARGWGVLCVEMPCFGHRAEMTEGALSKALLWRGRTLFGQMLGEQRAALRWLRTMPGVDPARIAVMGVSMGGTLAWWLSALEGGFAATVSTACFADLETLVASGAHDGHGPYMTVPGLLPLCSSGVLSGLSAPAPLMHCVGLRDWSTPPAAFDIARASVEAAYAAAGVPKKVQFVVEPDAGHEETVTMRARIELFLERTLC